eukprot:TRINITY_DN4534_c0_g5_i1.p1 TRINITY_DN4534_c0_g5~~TRINITY_DN4534_c0_g5_i1.p1  ORF type:complete len:466 (-),score=182.32 TRINITY_DN4534_c0_g5_i1:43-1440(-)
MDENNNSNKEQENGNGSEDKIEEEKQKNEPSATTTSSTSMATDEDEKKNKEEKEKSLYSTIFGSGDEDEGEQSEDKEEKKSKEAEAKSPSKKRKRESSSSKKKSKKRKSSSSKKSKRHSKKRKKSDSESDSNDSDMEEQSTRNSLEQVKALKRNMNSASTTSNDSNPNLDASKDDNDPNYEKPERSSSSRSSSSSIREKKPPKDSTPTNKDDIVNNWLEQMEEAYKADSAAISNNQPATRKLALLPALINTLSKSYLQECFMENEIFTHFAKWLTPLADGTLPNSKIRSELLEVMLKFPLPGKQVLRESGIGKIVRFLTQNEKDPKNKKKAEELVQRWASSIFEISTDYRELEMYDQQKQERKMSLGTSMEKKPKTLSQSTDNSNSSQNLEDEMMDDRKSERKEEQNDAGRRRGEGAHARIPEPARLDYVNRPRSKESGQKAQEGINRAKNIERRMKSMMRRRNK